MKDQIRTCLIVLVLGCPFAGAQDNAPIPWYQISARAGLDYEGDGLTVVATAQGARLHCSFQHLDAEATGEGLWLTSTVPGAPHDRFRVRGAVIGRETTAGGLLSATAGKDTVLGAHEATHPAALPAAGKVSVDGRTARFSRPGLVEEYLVSRDGVRQDFVVLEKPGLPVGQPPSTLSSASLRMELAVTGAAVEPTARGAELVLGQSGRRIAFSRLKVTDASGKQLLARMEVPGNSAFRGPHSESALVVVVDDWDATYPVRIDPTFSDANWISLGGLNGTDGAIYAAVVDGSGNLYIGGDFTVVDDVIANLIAKWDGSTWSAVGAGMGRDGLSFLGVAVQALAVSGTDVYVGGDFTTATNSDGVAVKVSGIARWNGSAWSALGQGLDGGVSALAVSGIDVYVGGDFTTATNSDGVAVTVNRVAKWDGSAWSALGAGTGGSVRALAVSGTDVYVGGGFGTATNSDGVAVTVNGSAKWNGSDWSALGGGLNGPVYALAVLGTDVYAGGSFRPSRIAKWDGSAWSTLGSGMNNTVYALAVSGNDVYAGGFFGRAGTNSASNIAKWNGSDWTTFGSGTDSYVRALAVSGSQVYAGGYFTTAGGSLADHIAKWNGSAWSALGQGIGGDGGPSVRALAVSGGEVYVGGHFTTTGGTAANHVAKWNGSIWSALGSGVEGFPNPYEPSVHALAVSGNNLYVGGSFSSAGGMAANYIAKWDGSGWSPLGLGMSSEVYALAASGGEVYAGGAFGIAKWNGSAWSGLGAGLNSSVYALAISGSNVYAGGSFGMTTNSDGMAVASCQIVKWDGGAWSALGSGMNYFVSALAVSGADVYAGGSFTRATNSEGVAVTVNCIAKWNGSGWSALGLGVGSDGSTVPGVFALAISGSNVYAGGNFTMATNSDGVAVTVNCIAKWDGNAWSALGSGIYSIYGNGSVKALALSDSDLYAGGDFTFAGGKVSPNFAKAIATPGNWLRIARGVPGPNTTALSFVGVPGQSYTMQFASNLHHPQWWPLGTTNTDTYGHGVVQDTDASAAPRFYRVTSP